MYASGIAIAVIARLVHHLVEFLTGVVGMHFLVLEIDQNHQSATVCHRIGGGQGLHSGQTALATFVARSNALAMECGQLVIDGRCRLEESFLRLTALVHIVGCNGSGNQIRAAEGGIAPSAVRTFHNGKAVGRAQAVEGFVAAKHHRDLRAVWLCQHARDALGGNGPG